MKLLRSLGFVVGISSAVVACKGDSRDAPAKDDAPLVAANAKPPSGLTFQRLDRPFASFELPTGAAWETVEDEAESTDRTVILIQVMYNTEPTRLDELLESYRDERAHNLPKYVRKTQTKGRLGEDIAARIEGTYDDGTKFATRDYLRFKNGKAISITARTPVENAAAMRPIVDYVAASVQIK